MRPAVRQLSQVSPCRYAWGSLSGRRDNCVIADWAELEWFDGNNSYIMESMQQVDNLEEFARRISTDFHAMGHNMVGEHCRDSPNPDNLGVMAYSEVSARYNYQVLVGDINGLTL